jgi:hypothetical protein
VPAEVQAEVESHVGKDYVRDRYTHRQLGKGKPPLSGWEEEKRRRERQKRRESGKMASE